MAKRTKLTVRMKRAWIKALRSGKYRQGRNQLYNPEARAYCCLGVLARIQGCKYDKIEGFRFPNGDNGFALLGSWGNSFGISDDSSDKLTQLNDDGTSFREISGWISKNL